MITSKDNQWIKHVKSLSQKKYRDSEKEFIIEGIKVLKEAIEYKEELVKIFICEELLGNTSIIDEINSYEEYKELIEYVPRNIFLTITDTITPQGVLAIVKQKQTNNSMCSNVIFALDEIQDPGNLGTIIRTLDASGYKDLLLSEGTAEPYNPKVVRSTMGAIFRLNLHRTTNLLEALMRFKKQGYEIVVTSLDTKEFYYDLNYADNMVVVMGNEAKGVSEEVQNIATKKIKIPMIGKTESLNVAVATSILAYEGVRQKFAHNK